MIETILRDLVAIPTVSGNASANNLGLDYIAAFLKQRGMHIKRHIYDGHGTLVATTRKTKKPTVMLVSHLDVVPAPPELFTMQQRGDRLYGRGVFDMKHAIAAFLAAVDQLGAKLTDYNFGIMIYTDDESVDFQIGYMLRDGYSCKVVVLPDGGDNWQVESTAKGLWAARLRMVGKSSHGSRPWEGDSASLRMIDLLHELRTDFAGHGPETDTLNVGLVQSGSDAWNQVPDSAVATLDMRILSEARKEVIEKRLLKLVSKYNAAFEEMRWLPPLLHDRNDPLMRQFSTCIKDVTGVTDEGFISHGASSAVYFMQRSIPCIITSPPGAGRHSDEEWIDRQALNQFPDIIQRYIEAVA